MRKIISIILIGALLVCLWNPTTVIVKAKDDDWWNTNWGYRKEITINHDMVATDLENFPILFNSTSTNFSDHAQNDGDDFVFISSDGTIQYNHEIEYYSGTTGELIAWVNITSLSSTVDTTLYIYYGNPSCSNQENGVGTWESNYVGVWHCNNEVDGGEGDIKDSTIYYNNGTTQNMEEEDFVKGRIAGAYNFDGSNERVLVYDSQYGSLDLTENFTLECWWKASDLSDDYNSLMGKRSNSGYQYEYRIRDTLFTKNRYSLLTTEGSRDDTTSKEEDIWYYGTVTRDSINITFYNDGSISSVHATAKSKSTNAMFGFGSAGDYTNYFAGIIDEVRVSKISQSAGWIETSYNTMSSPDTFLNIGPEESKPVTNIPPTVEITYPDEGEAVSGTINIIGKADDADGVVEYVEVKIDDEAWETASGTTNWAYLWDTNLFADGAHTIYARSYDGEDYSNVYMVNVTVFNGIDNIPPSVEIITPHYGCIYFSIGGTLYVYIPAVPIITLIIGKIYVIVNASDNVGVESVKFYVDDEPMDTDFELPYIWLWDTQSMIFPYDLKVVARDFAGNEATDMIKVWRIQIFPP